MWTLNDQMAHMRVEMEEGQMKHEVKDEGDDDDEEMVEVV
jgi:hypothetical protein